MSRTGRKRREPSAYLPLLVAIEDLLWLAILIPIGIAFQLLLVLAEGYYAARRRNPYLATAYTGAVLLTWVLMVGRARRRRKVRP